jgi:hypothetical protein
MICQLIYVNKKVLYLTRVNASMQRRVDPKRMDDFGLTEGYANMQYAVLYMQKRARRRGMAPVFQDMQGQVHCGR